MELEGHRWIPSDRRWWWDGQAWRNTPSGPGPLVRLLESAPATMWACRWILAMQGMGIGSAGLFAYMIGMLAALGGAAWTAVALFAAGTVALVVAAYFGLLALKSGRQRGRWRVVLLTTEVALLPVGLLLVGLLNSSSEDGTNSPFADGATGIMVLTGMAFAWGALIILGILLWERIGVFVGARKLGTRSISNPR